MGKLKGFFKKIDAGITTMVAKEAAIVNSNTAHLPSINIPKLGIHETVEVTATTQKRYVQGIEAALVVATTAGAVVGGIALAPVVAGLGATIGTGGLVSGGAAFLKSPAGSFLVNKGKQIVTGFNKPPPTFIPPAVIAGAATGCGATDNGIGFIIFCLIFVYTQKNVIFKFFTKRNFFS
jgi:hypothetical protein